MPILTRVLVGGKASAFFGAVPTTIDKNIAALVTVADGDRAIPGSISVTPGNHGYVMVAVNGKLADVGDGAKNADCYFSSDAGVTARAIADIVAGDTLHWIGSIARYELDTNDRISLYYDA